MPAERLHRIFIFFLTILALAALASCKSASGDRYIRIEGYAQGGTYHVICEVPAGVADTSAAARVEATLDAVDRSLSGYNKGSLLSKLNAGEDLPLDSCFINVFVRSQEIWRESDGAFDPSAAPLFDLWGFGFTDRSSVSDVQIDSILQFVGMDLFSLDTLEDGTVHLRRSDPRAKLNFNAIAQGYTCDAVASELEKLGSSNYLVEVGREILTRGLNSRGDKWRIGLDKPSDGNFDEGKNLQDIIDVTDCGIVTSGNYRKFYVENGEKYAHTLDPHTGRPVRHNLLSATVTAFDATTADAYATWFMVVGPEEARKIVEGREDLETYLIYGEQEDMKTWRTPGLTIEE